jgi:hypothetical protein
MDPETLRINTERAMIRATIPRGWESLHLRRSYDVDPAAVGTPIYGVCGHGLVCLLADRWLHPFPELPRVCDKAPATSHSGVEAFGPPA